ncbi:phosphoglycerate mutase family protein [Rhodococcus koreensis]
MFVVVRHAHAVGKATWRGAETNRPLSPLGHRQASGLVAALDGIELHTLFSSPTARCRDTLGALASDRVLPVQDHWLLAPDAPVDQLRAALCGSHIDGTLWCTHGEILDDLAAISEHDSRGDFPTAKTAKGGAWIFTPGADPRYLPPTPPA